MPCATVICRRVLTLLRRWGARLRNAITAIQPNGATKEPTKEPTKAATNAGIKCQIKWWTKWGGNSTLSPSSQVVRTSGFSRISVFGFPILILCPLLAGAQSASPSDPHQQFVLSRSHYQQHSNSVQAAWEFGRACFDLGEAATNNTERARIAQLGIEACRRATLAIQTPHRRIITSA